MEIKFWFGELAEQCYYIPLEAIFSLSEYVCGCLATKFALSLGQCQLMDVNHSRNQGSTKRLKSWVLKVRHVWFGISLEDLGETDGPLGTL
jgi:hypothetical protein